MADPPIWFKSFCVCELVVQFPFFFVGAYAFWKGIAIIGSFDFIYHDHELFHWQPIIKL